MIKLKRVYAPAEPSDGRRFLVDRVWPRGVRKDAANVEAWLKEAGPSDELRKWFGHDPQRWSQFRRRYLRELSGRQDVLAPLAQAAREGDITLVYSARDEQHNQAVVIKSLLEELLTTPPSEWKPLCQRSADPREFAVTVPAGEIHAKIDHKRFRRSASGWLQRRAIR